MWLEEVIEEKSDLEMRMECLEGDKEDALDEKVALEGWVRGSVAEQAETCTRLASFQASHLFFQSCHATDDPVLKYCTARYSTAQIDIALLVMPGI
jgi:hypothetical protein